MSDRIGFIYAFRGLRKAFLSQANLQVHTFFSFLVLGCGFFLKISYSEWGLLILSISLVLVSEFFNTAIEMVMDKVSPNWNKKVGDIKDVSAAGVLVSSFSAVIMGSIIFIPKFLNIIQ